MTTTATTTPDGVVQVRARQLGSWPGTDLRQAVEDLLGVESAVLTVPVLPDRGIGATLLARTLALVPEFGFDVQPTGWRIAGGPSFDQRRARGCWRDDRDVLEESLAGVATTVVMQVLGPWSLATRVELPRGGPVLADLGARRDLAQAWAAGLAETVAALSRRLSGCGLEVVLAEPELGRVLDGTVATASGYRTLPAVDGPELVDVLAATPTTGWVLDGAGASLVAGRCGAGGSVVDLPILDPGTLDPRTLDSVATEAEEGRRVVLTALAEGAAPEVGRLTAAVVDPLRRLELGTRWGESLTMAVRTSARQPVTQARAWWARILAAAPAVGEELSR